MVGQNNPNFFKRIGHIVRRTRNRIFGFIDHSLPKQVGTTIRVLKYSINFFKKHDTTTLGAGLSYYMVFSIAPVIIIFISVVGSILGPDAVTGALKEQIQGLFGSGTANHLQDMVKAAYRPGKNWIATTLSVVVLLTGALGVFTQLRSSLNVIWDVKPAAKKPWLQYLLARLFSFGMIACLALLLLVSLVVHTALAALSGYLDVLLPHLSKILMRTIEVIISFTITSALFAFVYKFMSDAKMKWKNVWWGAVFTAFLFALGKYLIGLYISKSNLTNTYGTASSVIIIMLWVFYSSQIVFFGAEFTRALVTEHEHEKNSRIKATSDN